VGARQSTLFYAASVLAYRVTEYNPGARVVEMLNSVSICASLNRPVNKAGNDRSILCVDDEPAVLHTTALILRRAGYSAVTAVSAEDSLHLLNSQPFDLLRLDGIPERELVIQEARRVHPGVRIALNVGNPDLGDEGVGQDTGARRETAAIHS
jgi:hypothetical protein